MGATRSSSQRKVCFKLSAPPSPLQSAHSFQASRNTPKTPTHPLAYGLHYERTRLRIISQNGFPDGTEHPVLELLDQYGRDFGHGEDERIPLVAIVQKGSEEDDPKKEGPDQPELEKRDDEEGATMHVQDRKRGGQEKDFEEEVSKKDD